MLLFHVCFNQQLLWTLWLPWRPQPQPPPRPRSPWNRAPKRNPPGGWALTDGVYPRAEMGISMVAMGLYPQKSQQNDMQWLSLETHMFIDFSQDFGMESLWKWGPKKIRCPSKILCISPIKSINPSEVKLGTVNPSGFEKHFFRGQPSLSRCLVKSRGCSFHWLITYTMWGPPVISWLTKAPVTIVISTINHSYWSYVHQLNAILGASHCSLVNPLRFKFHMLPTFLIHAIHIPTKVKTIAGYDWTSDQPSRPEVEDEVSPGRSHWWGSL